MDTSSTSSGEGYGDDDTRKLIIDKDRDPNLNVPSTQAKKMTTNPIPQVPPQIMNLVRAPAPSVSRLQFTIPPSFDITKGPIIYRPVFHSSIQSTTDPKNTLLYVPNLQTSIPTTNPADGTNLCLIVPEPPTTLPLRKLPDTIKDAKDPTPYKDDGKAHHFMTKKHKRTEQKKFDTSKPRKCNAEVPLIGGEKPNYIYLAVVEILLPLWAEFSPSTKKEDLDEIALHRAHITMAKANKTIDKSLLLDIAYLVKYVSVGRKMNVDAYGSLERSERTTAGNFLSNLQREFNVRTKIPTNDRYKEYVDTFYNAFKETYSIPVNIIGLLDASSRKRTSTKTTSQSSIEVSKPAPSVSTSESKSGSKSASKPSVSVVASTPPVPRSGVISATKPIAVFTGANPPVLTSILLPVSKSTAAPVSVPKPTVLKSILVSVSAPVPTVSKSIVTFTASPPPATKSIVTVSEPDSTVSESPPVSMPIIRFAPTPPPVPVAASSTDDDNIRPLCFSDTDDEANDNFNDKAYVEFLNRPRNIGGITNVPTSTQPLLLNPPPTSLWRPIEFGHESTRSPHAGVSASVGQPLNLKYTSTAIPSDRGLSPVRLTRYSTSSLASSPIKLTSRSSTSNRPIPSAAAGRNPNAPPSPMDYRSVAQGPFRSPSDSESSDMDTEEGQGAILSSYQPHSQPLKPIPIRPLPSHLPICSIPQSQPSKLVEDNATISYSFLQSLSQGRSALSTLRKQMQQRYSPLRSNSPRLGSSRPKEPLQLSSLTIANKADGDNFKFRWNNMTMNALSLSEEEHKKNMAMNVSSFLIEKPKEFSSKPISYFPHYAKNPQKLFKIHKVMNENREALVYIKIDTTKLDAEEKRTLLDLRNTLMRVHLEPVHECILPFLGYIDELLHNGLLFFPTCGVLKQFISRHTNMVWKIKMQFIGDIIAACKWCVENNIFMYLRLSDIVVGRVQGNYRCMVNMYSTKYLSYLDDKYYGNCLPNQYDEDVYPILYIPKDLPDEMKMFLTGEPSTVHAIGIIMWRIINNNKPLFEGMDENTANLHIFHENFPPVNVLRKANPNVKSDLVNKQYEIIKKCLSVKKIFTIEELWSTSRLFVSK